MSQAPLKCVVDASVGIKLFINEPLSDRADAVFSQLVADPPGRLFVPDLFFIECANILWKHIQRFGYPVAQARNDLVNLGKLALRSVPTASLNIPALEIAVDQSISAYDATYVALAHRLNVPFVTADEKLVRKLSGTPHAVSWLGNFEIPPLHSP
jgi:predicted nucleic acid-binding protein